MHAVSTLQHQCRLGHCFRSARVHKQQRFAGSRAQGNGSSPISCEFKPGSRVKVASPVKVWHVGKFKEGLSLEGLEGVIQANVTEYKGEILSANLPWKIQFSVPAPDGGKDVKVIAHLAEDEIQALE